MAVDPLPILLAAVTVLSGAALFLQRKLLRSVVLLAMAAAGSALIFLYLGQVLIALLQLLVFVGGLSTYLIVAVATEEKKVNMRSAWAFVLASVVIAAGLLAAVSTLNTTQQASNSFSASAESAIQGYYAVFFSAVFLLFAAAIGSVAVIKKFSRLVV